MVVSRKMCAFGAHVWWAWKLCAFGTHAWDALRKNAPSAHIYWGLGKRAPSAHMYDGHGKYAPSAHSFWRVTENMRLWRMSEMNCRLLEASPRGIVAGVVA